MPDMSEHLVNDPGGDPPSGGLTRRRILAGAGAALAGTVAAVGAGREQAGAVEESGVGLGPEGTTTVEFRGRIAQTGSSGQTFISIGYLTRVTGTEPTDLFEGADRNESTALFTAYATGDLTARVLDQSVHALDIVGDLSVYQRSRPGATFADPSSFRLGTRVARYHLTLQDILAVIAAGQGIPTLVGDMRQAESRALSGSLSGNRLGRTGMRLRFFATGLGRLTDPVTLNAELEVAGNWSVEETSRRG
jgi:hypothetical protein